MCVVIFIEPEYVSPYTPQVCEELLVTAHEEGMDHVWWVDMQVLAATESPPYLFGSPDEVNGSWGFGSSAEEGAFTYRFLPSNSLISHSSSSYLLLSSLELSDTKVYGP